MNNSTNNIISLDERIKMMKNSKSTSPEAAFAKYKWIANAPVTDFVFRKEDLDIFCDQLGSFANIENWDIDHYASFCEIYNRILFSLNLSNAVSGISTTDSSFVMNPTGITFINSMALLANLFLERTRKSEMKKPNKLYYGFNMTLEDFWNAALHNCTGKDGKINTKRIKYIESTRDEFMRNRDYSDSLKKVIADLLCEYQKAYRVFGHLDYVIRCNIDFNDHMRYSLPTFTFDSNPDAYQEDYPDLMPKSEEETLYEDAEAPLEDQYLFDTDPREYYLQLAKNYQPPNYDFHDEDVKGIRYEILLSRPSYSEKALKHLSKSIDNKPFRDMFDNIVGSEFYSVYKCIIGERAKQIYNLLVAPFIGSLNHEYTESIDI